MSVEKCHDATCHFTRQEFLFFNDSTILGQVAKVPKSTKNTF